MKFDDLDNQMRGFEAATDRHVPEDHYVVARIDGRGFTRLTKELYPFEAPFDVKFRDMMIATVEHLMACGFRVAFGFTQSDEISLLFHVNENAFGRKTRKFISILAGEASAKFSLQLGGLATFDCRLCELPNAPLVRDYFRWRSEDAHRNALNAHCYWAMRKTGASVGQATRQLEGISLEEKTALLAGFGIEFGFLPLWQTRGIGFVWTTVEKPATNPKTGAAVVAVRRSLTRILELPEGAAYGQFIEELLRSQLAE